ncbi:Histone Chaperone Asf1A [Manis pentadactyla]|nr:Histone Chaperone Asf1A [Manis pentadactyla]
MAKVQVNYVVVLDNPSPFYNLFQFEITECIEDLSEDLEWKIIYVGSAESEYNQVLDSVLVGPVPAGRHMLVFQADAPNPGLSPDADAVARLPPMLTWRQEEQAGFEPKLGESYLDQEVPGLMFTRWAAV